MERLPIIVSSNGIEKLLGVPICDGKSGEDIANTVTKILSEWSLLDKIQGMCFDTTASNTGVHKGACRFLEKKPNRELLHFACRHHICEVVKRGAFESKFGPTKSPDVKIFAEFREAWDAGQIDRDNCKSGIEVPLVRRKISNAVSKNVIEFCREQLKKDHSRKDYKEFLELVLIFYGENVPNFKVRPPGAISHARWMAKAIYLLKMFIFRDQFGFGPGNFDKIRDMCIFLVTLYVKIWFGCTNGITAANQDLQFIKDAIAYAAIDKSISAAILLKMTNHLWYLAEELMAMAFYDNSVSTEEKKKMVENLNRPPFEYVPKNNKTNPEDIRKSDPTLQELMSYTSKNLSDFVTEKTLSFFDRFCLSTEFMQYDPSTWMDRQDYREGLAFCSVLHVVNDAAERGVKMMTDFNAILSRKEEEKQFMLQVVEMYRQQHQSHVKSSLLN